MRHSQCSVPMEHMRIVPVAIHYFGVLTDFVYANQLESRSREQPGYDHLERHHSTRPCCSGQEWGGQHQPAQSFLMIERVGQCYLRTQTVAEDENGQILMPRDDLTPKAVEVIDPVGEAVDVGTLAHGPAMPAKIQ